MGEREEIARDYADALIQQQLRAMYRAVYGAGFFWGFISALTGALAFYAMTA